MKVQDIIFGIGLLTSLLVFLLSFMSEELTRKNLFHREQERYDVAIMTIAAFVITWMIIVMTGLLVCKL